MSTDSIFTQIINRELPATVRYEDENFIAFDNLYPKAPVHVLLVPKKPYETLERVELTDEQFHSSLLITARKIAQQLGIADNYKLVMNIGKDVQEIYHLHLHIMGGWASGEHLEALEL